ncbi:hypothetical protein LQK80_13490 [Bacillus thuringiensis]|nr:hypothetical protein [Bacillus thuringiensis]
MEDVCGEEKLEDIFIRLVGKPAAKGGIVLVNVLIQMKLSILKHSMNRGRAVLFIMTGLVGLLLAIGTILLFLFIQQNKIYQKHSICNIRHLDSRMDYRSDAYWRRRNITP